MSAASNTIDPTHDEHHDWKPAANPWMIAASVMLATFMVVLDSSVANVALPHIAGSLSASTDESTWVLTSYLVANAIMLPAAGWIARRIGRARLLLFSILLFTVASLLCGMALTMPMLIVARVLQGIGGGGMQPLAQSILLESFPPRQHGTAMAAYGVGVIVAPIIGPTLGGWITDSYSWRWIFYINLPIGILALIMVNLYVEDPPYLRHKFKGAIDYLGFGLMALWLGTLQLVLDKGQEADWFAAPWICWTAAVSALALIGFIARELTDHDPIVQLRIFRDRNFAVGTMITCTYGFVLYGATAHAALVSANADGLLRAAKRSGHQPARHRRHGFDDDGGPAGAQDRRSLADGLWLRAAGRIHLDAGQHQPANRNVFGRRPQHSQRLCDGLHLCSADHGDAEPPAQAGDGQRHRHLQPGAHRWAARSASPP